jgi:hypothetical protein
MRKPLHRRLAPFAGRHALLLIALFATVVPACLPLHAADDCSYRSFDGTVKAGGVDSWTYVNTPIWAVLRYSGGLASELEIENHDPAHAIYFSGPATGTNQFNAGNGRTGQEVSPGGKTSFALSLYQSRGSPITSIAVTWEYCAAGASAKAWTPKPNNAGGHSTPELEAALLAAVKRGELDAIMQLLQSGASADATDPRYGYSALMLAARANSLDAVRALLDAHADPNRKANCGDAGIAVVQLLLQSGADPRARQKDGFTALGIIRGGTAPRMESVLRAAGVPQ